jgi:hypothetical protein
MSGIPGRDADQSDGPADFTTILLALSDHNRVTGYDRFLFHNIVQPNRHVHIHHSF